MSWFIVAAVCVSAPLLLAISAWWLSYLSLRKLNIRNNFSFVYNSPVWYLRKSKESSAFLALKQIRPNNEMVEVNEEFYKLKSSFKEVDENSSCSSISKIVTEKQYFQPLASLNILFLLMLFSGKFAIEMYAVGIFNQTQDSMDENIATIFLGKIYFCCIFQIL